jgi:hypothetical protein
MSEMNEQHEQLLLKMLATNTLPPEVRARYDKVKKIADRVDALVSVQMLTLIAAEAKDITAKPQAESKEQEQKKGPQGKVWANVKIEGKLVRAYLADDQKPVKEGNIVVVANEHHYEVPEADVNLD